MIGGMPPLVPFAWHHDQGVLAEHGKFAQHKLFGTFAESGEQDSPPRNG
ncbi:MAG: hypothetical protein R3F38_08930 [Gammaproteobacteria bacterium]